MSARRPRRMAYTLAVDFIGTFIGTFIGSSLYFIG